MEDEEDSGAGEESGKSGWVYGWMELDGGNREAIESFWMYLDVWERIYQR